ncbi:MAG: PH domain-containing protein [Chloroflexota bacterium]
MSQSYLHSMLGERERVVFIARQHWLILARNIAMEIFFIALILFGVVFTAITYADWGWIAAGVGFLILLLPLGSMARDILNWTNKQFVITNRRVIKIWGIFNKVVADSSLEKVNDIKMVQSAIGRIMDYGDIEILTASEMGTNLFKQIERPVSFKTALLNAKEAVDSREDLHYAAPQENIPALIAQLDTLRQQGVLSEAEFQAKKTQLLSKL